MDPVADRQEQYSRRNCLLVHGILGKTVEDTDEKIISTRQQSMDETINLRILIDHTSLARLSP